MTHYETVGTARETTVGNQCHGFAQTLAHDGAGGFQHFRHARSAFGPTVTNHDHVTGNNFLLVNGLVGFGFTVVDLGRATEPESFLAGNFGNGALFGEVAVENPNMTTFL